MEYKAGEVFKKVEQKGKKKEGKIETSSAGPISK